MTRWFESGYLYIASAYHSFGIPLRPLWLSVRLTFWQLYFKPCLIYMYIKVCLNRWLSGLCSTWL
ncbi:hypothetical protein CLU79DRAFT_749185 [Phycomyces nitens]|nr:hypothetical protein CLU79DRAFT_749185 [Phycomyces nitens]